MSAYHDDYNNMEVISLACGSGGKLYHRLVEEVFVPAFDNVLLRPLNDSALCNVPGETIALTTDSFVVRPRFFPGGDIGRLAVCGTVNDLAMSGATPRYLTCAMIIEAGLAAEELRRVCASMAAAAREAGVMIVTGDTKVVEKGACDGLYVNTAGVGVFSVAHPPLPQKIRPGDAVLFSGTMGDHGMAVMAARENFGFTPALESDVAPLNGIVASLLSSVPDTHALRDATRGGVAAVTNEWALACGRDISLIEENLPVRPQVRAACELLGLDPLLVANEGKFVAAVAPEQAEAALAALHGHPLGREAAVIGYVEAGGRGRVSLNTPYGTRRIIDLPDGEQLPRIC